MARKLTKNCIFPWRSIEFDGAGNISPCCGTVTGDFGTVSKDFLTNPQRFNTPDYVRLRQSLLSGELLDACRDCRAVHAADIPPEALQEKIRRYLQSRGIDSQGADPARLFAFDEGGGNITNRCNFSCRYCCHSGPEGHKGWLAEVMPKPLFLAFVDMLVDQGLTILNFCGLGELTIYPGWQGLIRKIHKRYPHLRIRLISNFGRRLSESDFKALSQLEMVHVSCDTLDEALFDWLRQKGALPVLLDNVRRLIAFLGPESRTRVVFNVTVSDAVSGHLEPLFRFAAEQGIFIHLSALFEMEGTAAVADSSLRKIWAGRGPSILSVREEFLDLPRRFKAANPFLAVWEYQYLYKKIMSRADHYSKHQFAPQREQLFYQLCAEQISSPHCYLKRFWTSFDTLIQGLYFTDNHAVRLQLPWPRGFAEIRAYGVRRLLDGNCLLYPQEPVSGETATELVLEPCSGDFDSVLLEVLRFEKNEGEGPEVQEPFQLIAYTIDSAPILIRESVVDADMNRLVSHFVNSGEELVIWCAGIKTLEVLSETELSQARIRAIVDSDTKRQGQEICGIRIVAPEEIRSYCGKILVLHASTPERVEVAIRRLGFDNEVLTP